MHEPRHEVHKLQSSFMLLLWRDYTGTAPPMGPIVYLSDGTLINMQNCWNDKEGGKIEVIRESAVIVTLCPP
jgi:hypothetical protein